MVEESAQHSTPRHPRLRHLAVLCVKLAVPVMTCCGLAILLALASTAGPQALAGCACYLATSNLKLVYSVSLACAAAWVSGCLLLDGISIGPVVFRSHELLRLGELPAFPINLLISLCFAILGIKIGYAFREACQRARKRLKALETTRWQQATPG